jgi:hypothetical protein
VLVRLPMNCIECLVGGVAWHRPLPDLPAFNTMRPLTDWEQAARTGRRGPAQQLARAHRVVREGQSRAVSACDAVGVLTQTAFKAFEISFGI